jgi:hypothetical protein
MSTAAKPQVSVRDMTAEQIAEAADDVTFRLAMAELSGDKVTAGRMRRSVAALAAAGKEL